MTFIHPQSRSAQTGSAALAVVVAAGLLAMTPQRSEVPIAAHQVQLQAAILSAVSNSATTDVASPTGPESWSAPSGIETEKQASPAAAATEDSFWDSPLGTVLSLANLLVLPLWFIATPFTLPLTMVIAASQVTLDGPFGTLQWLISTGLGFLTGPLGLFVLVTSQPASAAAAGRAANENQDLAEGASVHTASEIASAPDGGANNLEAVPADEPTASADTQPRDRLAVRQSGAAPRATAAATAVTPALTDIGIERAAGESFDEVQVAPQGDEADQPRSSAAEKSGGKASTQRPSRR